MTAAPDAVVFRAPPTWPVPDGFDPRRGHLADPAWPAAPEGWQFWVADPLAGPERAALPSATLRPHVGERPAARRRLVLALVGVAAVVGLALWVAIAFPGEEPPGVGSCWAGTGEWLDEVSCSSPGAAYVVVSRTDTPQECPVSSFSYLEVDGAILCLEPH